MDVFHYHEVLDRLHLAQFMLEDHLLSHPAMEENLAIKNMVAEAQELLGKAYQAIGQASEDKFGART